MLLLLVAVAMNCLYAEVYTGSCGTNVTYSLDTETGELTISGTGAMYDYAYKDYDEVPWYSEKSYIHEVVIKEGVTTIGNYAFYNISYLSSVTIPNSVTSIGKSAFSICTSLSFVSIPNSVTSIGESAFYACTSLSSITIGNSVTSIGDFAFGDCIALTAVHYTGDMAGWCGITFDGYESNPLQYAHNLYIDNTLVSELVIPESITEIKDNTFRGSSVTQVTIPNSVTSIGSYAFVGCSGLTSITIPNSVTSIGDYAFSGCLEMTELRIEDSTDQLTFGLSVFGNCPLSTVYLGRNFTYTSDSPFDGKYSIHQLTIGNSVTSIGDYAFYKCSGLSFISIPNSVTSIGSYAFAGCSGLTELLIPGSVTSIGNNIITKCHIDKIFMFPEMDFRNYFDKLWYKSLYMQELTMVQQDIFDNPTDSIYSLADYYIETRSELTNGIFKVSLTPRYENVTINYVQYKSSKDGNYQELLQGADGYYYFETTPEWPEYDLSIGVSIGDHSDQKLSKKLGEIVPNPTYTFLNSTQTTLQFQVESIKPSWCTEYGVCTYDWWWGNSIDSYYPVDEEGVVTITGLIPELSYYIRAYAIYGDTILYSTEQHAESFETLDVSPSISVISRTPTTLTVKGDSGHGDATLIESGFTKTSGSKEFISGDEMKWTNLSPDSTYTFYYATHTEEGGYDRTTLEVATLHPNLTTESAQPTSTTSVRLMATANLDDEEMRAGFQWRRYDAPDEMPSNEVSCPVVEGSLVGSLRNVNPEVYYKYRPFLKINDTYYYGDWVVFFTGDAAVYFEPEVRTYDALSVTANGATLDGYALEGSDAISSQGFEYWATTPLTKASTNGGVQKVTVSGIRMQTTLTDLEPGTTYSFRAFATTASGTVYGEEKQFTTEPVIAVEEIKGSNGLEMDVKLRSNPVTRGTAWVQVSGTTAAAVQYRVVSITGQTMSAGTLTCGEWQSIDASFPAGMYLLMVNDGTKSRTVKFIVK